MSIQIAGHTDNTGEPEANMTLSESRANAVHDYLVSQGISENRLQAAGYGQSRPVDTNDTDEGRKNNRRTELQILTQ